MRFPVRVNPTAVPTGVVEARASPHGSIQRWTPLNEVAEAQASRRVYSRRQIQAGVFETRGPPGSTQRRSIPALSKHEVPGPGQSHGGPHRGCRSTSFPARVNPTVDPIARLVEAQASRPRLSICPGAQTTEFSTAAKLVKYSKWRTEEVLSALQQVGHHNLGSTVELSSARIPNTHRCTLYSGPPETKVSRA